MKVSLVFGVFGVAGTYGGARLAHRFSQETLKRAFGWFLVLVATYLPLKNII